MLEISTYQLPDVIPHDELMAWRAKIKKIDSDCPPEVKEFIEALACKLDDFMRYGKDRAFIRGSELHLAGITQWQGEQVFKFAMYELDVPKMMACDHRGAMYKLYKRKGKQGLIDFCKAKVKGTELQRLLEVLNVYVFHQERAEFQKIMAEIHASKKLEKDLQL